MGASLQNAEHPAHVVFAPGLSERNSFRLRQVDDGVGRENELVREPGRDRQSLAAGVGLYRIFRALEDYLGEAALLGGEVVAGHVEQVDAPLGFGGEHELRHAVGSVALAAEEELQLSLGALGGIGAVDEVIGEAQGQVAANGAWGGLGGVGCAHKPAHDLYSALALHPHGDDRGRGYELHQLLEERLLAVLGVVLLGQLAAHLYEPQGTDVQALGLDAAYDLPDQAAAHAITFDQYERLLHLLILLPVDVLFALHRGAVRAGIPAQM